MTKKLLFYLLLAAFCIRFLYLSQFAGSPFFRPARGLDPYLYQSWALSLLDGGWFGTEVFKAMPLYPYLLALFYALCGRDLFFVYALQLLVGVLNCFLLYRLGKLLEGPPLGLLSAFFLAFSGVSIFYEAMLVPTVVVSCSLLFTLLIVSHAKTSKAWFLGGVAWGLSALAHAGILLWSPFLILAGLFGDSQRSFSKKTLALGGCLLAFLSLLSLSALRNFLAAGETVFFTAHGGINFFIGNNPEATGQFHSHFTRYTSAEQLFQQSKREAERQTGHPLTDGESSRFWFQRGMTFVRENPVAFLRLLRQKWSLFWNGYEIPDVEDFYFFRREFPILKFAPFQSAFLSPLALLGICLSVRAWRRFFLLYGMLGAMIVGMLLFFVNSRYRAPLLPILSLFASFGCLRLVGFLRQKQPYALLGSLFLLFHLALWTGTDLPVVEGGIGHYNAAIAYTHAGLFDKAIQQLNRALLTTQDEGMVHFALGNAYFGQGNFEKAAEEFQETVRDHPDFADAAFNLGVTSAKLNRKKEAREALHRALELDPEARDIRRELEKLGE